MATITVYPNNSVTIDGVSAPWEKKDFREHGIPMERVRSRWRSEDEAEIKFDRGNKYIVFPTTWHVSKKELAKGKTYGARTCSNRACQKTFVAHHWRQKTCSRRCAVIVNTEQWNRRMKTQKKREYSHTRFDRRGVTRHAQAA